MGTQRKVRFGLIGFGEFAQRAVLPAMRAVSQVDVVAVQKRSLPEAQERARANGIGLAFASAEELLAHPSVDAVFIVSANAAHYPETLAAAQAGKHVLVEKPMALSVKEAQGMIDACRRSEVRLMVGHLTRFSPLLRRVREIVRSGTLGAVKYARADFVYDARLSRRGWLLDRTVAGGGPVFDIGVHCLDTLRFVLDDEVVSVTAELEPAPTPERTEESGLIGLKFGKGTIGAIFCSFLSSARRKQLEIVGTEGMVTAGDFTAGNQQVELVVTHGNALRGSSVQKEVIAVPNLIGAEVAHFANAICEGGPIETPGENGLANQRVLDAVMHGTPLQGRA